jgi:uroporphyrinogen decarboxylase
LLSECAELLPDGMKFIVPGPGGLLENVIYLTGFENLCFMLLEDEGLCSQIFDTTGKLLLRYYEKCSSFESVGALIVNDDWGFKSQTMFDPDTLRQFVFPWHRKIVEQIHKTGKYAILHSCGNIEDVMEDIVSDLKYDAKHSFEDNILPVEEAYRLWSGKIAILGGIDVDFLARANPEEIKDRVRKMLNMTGLNAYALGSGNSIPPFIPFENYLAMIEAFHEFSI